LFSLANSFMDPRCRADGQRGKKALTLPEGFHLTYYAFDWIPVEVFKAGEGGPDTSLRQIKLQQILIRLRQQKYLQNRVHLKQLQQEIIL